MILPAEFSQTRPVRTVRVPGTTWFIHVFNPAVFGLDSLLSTDCNHALKVLAASGKLEEIVAQQQKGEVEFLTWLL